MKLEITLLDLLYLSQVRYFIYLFIIYTALKAVTWHVRFN